MAAISMEELVRREAVFNLKPDGLTYQKRLSRIAKYEKGEEWSEPPVAQPKTSLPNVKNNQGSTGTNLFKHPLYGKKLLITPLMTPDKNRAIYFEEPIGPDITVEEVQAGKLLYDQAESVDRMVGDYKIISQNPNRVVTAKTTLPKIGQEISFTVGKDLVPVVRGNDKQVGYIWSFPTHIRVFEDTAIQLYGLKTLITSVYPELLPRFSGKPTMMYVDGLVLAAAIPQTDAILKEHRRRELIDAQAGLR